MSVLADQELLEVPLDSLQAQKARLLGLHPLPYWFCLVSVDVRLAQDWECDTVVELAKALNIIVAAWILSTELVAWEADDLEVVVFWLQFCYMSAFAVRVSLVHMNSAYLCRASRDPQTVV